MNFEYSPYILPLIAAAIVSATVAIYAWMRRSANGALALSLMSASIFVWTVGYSFEIAGTNIETKYFWGVIQYFGIAFAPYFWLIFAIVYSDNAKIITRRFLILTALIPSITVLLALTTKWHGLIWSEYHIEQQGNFSALGVSHGPWFWVHFAYSYIILLIGTVLLARVLWRRRGMYRGQVAAMLVAVITPWVGNALYLTGNSPIPYLDLTPFAFTVSVAALAWAVFGFHLVDITPLARDRVVDSMREGMIVLDVRGNIVDINNAAARMIGVSAENAIGKTAADVFHPWSYLVDRFRNVMEAKDEISVGEGEAKRNYEVRLSPLQDQQGQFVGRVIMLRAMDEEALQQERDLLERLVEERTHELAAIRDESVKISNELRKYYRAIEQSGNTIVITDTNGNIEYANPKFEQSTGYSIAEAKGRKTSLLKSGRQPAEYYSQLWKTISGGNAWNGEFLNKRKDGSMYWESATIAPVLDQSGTITNYVAIKEDITARRQTEEQLRKLSQAVEQSGNTVIIMDDNGLIEYVNPKFTEVTGYSSEEALGRSPISLMNGLGGDVPDFTQDEWWMTVNAGSIWRGEFQNHRKDGSVFWESATITPVLNREGEVINFVEIKQDITEQKILQDQLQKQNDYLSVLHQITLDLLNRRELNDLLQVVVDRSAVLLDAPSSQLMLEEDGILVVAAVTDNLPSVKGDRITREHAKLSWQAFDTHQPVVLEDYSTWEHRDERYAALLIYATIEIPVMAGERCLGILTLSRFQPNYRFTTEQVETGILFARLVALVLDNANLYDSAMKEIDRRKRTVILLLESEARFRQIVENASDIIYRTDLNGNFTYANPSALKMMGYTSEQDVIGKRYLDLTTPEFRHQLKRVYDHQYISKTKSTYYEFPAVTSDGQVVWVGQNVQLIMDGEQVAGFQAVARNITQLKQAQEALALSRDQALDASRFKSQLLSRVSHELRTPLGGILGYAELLQYKAFGSLTEQQHNAVNNIVESTHYLTTIVNDLLDEAQIESKSLSLHNEYFNPVDLLEKIRSTMSTLAHKKELTFRAEISDDLPSELYGDVNRLQQVIFNLAGNAIKFTKQGEVSVSVKRPAPAHWSIEVHDTGAGIVESEHESIFEPFRQVNNSITRENRGSGLGLAITRQLVELMGGQISLESEIGKGSLFTVTLPITNAPGE
jgi:PAS domain S-box-containing protein